MEIPEKYIDLFTGRHIAHLATINPDGSPQVTPVWIDIEGNMIIVNTARGRRKEKNLFLGAKVALSIVDINDPYRYVSVQGTVIGVTEDGALEHIIKLSHRYFGRDFKRAENEIRVMITIEIRHFFPKN